VLVRINDRGPFIKGRHVDLSREAARTLNMLRSGVTAVQFEVISNTRGEPLRRDEAFYLVLRSAGSPAEAASHMANVYGDLPDKLRKRLPRPSVFVYDRDARLPRFFVGLGPFANFAEAHARLFRFPLAQRPEMVCVKASPGREGANSQ